MNQSQSARVNQRYLQGIGGQPKQMLQPISGYAREPLLSLEQACEPLHTIVPDLPPQVGIAKENSKNPADGLTHDESAAIYLYTMEWESADDILHQSLYSHLNRTLKQVDRQKLRPWYRYLKLFLTALAKLPPAPYKILWRGVRIDCSAIYPNDSKTIWWSVSSCTSSLSVLESDLYLGNSGTRTLFSIEAFNGRTVRNHSFFTAEDEILLFPGTCFEVISQLHPAPDMHIIHLRQIKSEYDLLEPPFEGAQIFPDIPDPYSNTTPNPVELIVDEKVNRRPWYKKKITFIGLALVALAITIAIILGAVLGTQKKNNKSSPTTILAATIMPSTTTIVLVNAVVPVNIIVPVNTTVPVNTIVPVNTTVPVNTIVPVNTTVPVNASAHKVISWSGYLWNVRNEINPGSNNDNFTDNNVWVDSNGFVHLKLSYDSIRNQWWCAELSSQTYFSFGTFVFYVESRLDQLDPNVGVTIFTFNPVTNIPAIDIEFSTYGNKDPGAQNLYYKLFSDHQNTSTSYTQASTHMTLYGTYTTHRFDWKTDSIALQSQGDFEANTNQNIFFQYSTNASWAPIVSQIPAPVHINLRTNPGVVPINNQEVEIVVHNFFYTNN